MQMVCMAEGPAKKWWCSCVGQQVCMTCFYENTGWISEARNRMDIPNLNYLAL